jgi:hypothetical protein
VVRKNGRPIAIVSPPEPSRGRSLSECIALLPADSTATMDEDFAKDVNVAIESYQVTLDPPDSD